MIYLFLIVILIFINSTTSIAQDKPWEYVYCQTIHENSLWVGTKVGITKFDLSTGNYKIYDKSNSNLPCDLVYEIFIDKNNIKWIATYGGGLAKLDKESIEVFNSSNSNLPSNNIFAIASDNQSELWLGSDKGLIKFNSSNIFTFNQDNSPLPSNLIFDITIENDSTIWIATLSGLVKIYNNIWTVYTRNNSGLPHDTIFGVKIISGKLFVGTMMGVTCFDGNIWETILTNKTQCIAGNDTASTLWAGTTDGLKRRESGIGWMTYNSDNSILSNNYIQYLAIQENHTLWVGTWGGGLYRYVYGNSLNYWEKYQIPHTSVSENICNLPTQIKLLQNYPNPANPSTTIKYYLPRSCNVLLKIFNLAGREIEILVDRFQIAGEYKVKWVAQELPSGIYFYRLQIGDFSETKKLILQK